MEIQLNLLEKYCRQNGTDVTICINSEDKEPFLRFIKGNDRNGSCAVYLSFENLDDILIVNGMLGEEGMIIKERDATRQELQTRLANKRDKDKNIEFLTYDTLSKYIVQMLDAARAKILFKDILPLDGHRNIYFRNEPS